LEEGRDRVDEAVDGGDDVVLVGKANGYRSPNAPLVLSAHVPRRHGLRMRILSPLPSTTASVLSPLSTASGSRPAAGQRRAAL